MRGLRALLGGVLALLGAAGLSLPAAASENPVAAALAAHDWARAEALAVKPGAAQAGLAGKLITYMRLRVPGAASVPELGDFIAANADWPDLALLRRNLAEALVAEHELGQVRAWCAAYHPEQAEALLACAQAVRAGAARPEAANGPAEVLAESYARAAWRSLPEDAGREAAFLAQWQAGLRAEDDWARFEALPCGAGAARVVARLPADAASEARARLAFCGNAANAEDVLAAVAQARRGSPALFLAHAKWLRARDDLAGAIRLWRAQGLAEHDALPALRAGFWSERDRLARLALAASLNADAYYLADDAEAGPEAAPDALFLAGFIALRRLHDAGLAAAKFQALQAASPALITQARAWYWLGLAAGGSDAARADFEKAAAFPTTFYGQAAAAELGAGAPRLAQLLAKLHDPEADRAEAAAFAGLELRNAAELAAAWGLEPQARGFLLRAMRRKTSPGWFPLVADEARGLGLADVAVTAARLAGRFGIVMREAGWPRPAAFAGQAPLAIAIARQESNFDARIVSASGAQGLMQLMPATGAEVARGLGLGGAPDLFDPGTNIRIGSAYFEKLMAEFGNTAAYAIAAYNAGPRHVREWIAQNGDAAASNDPHAMQDWIELIPFNETRNYVQRVLENAAMYAALP